MEFWIDVGGTFTDCIGRLDDGRLTRHKLLSSGVTKGTIAAGSQDRRIIDPTRRRDPDHFWDGYTVHVLDADGQVVTQSEVTSFDRTTGTLHLAARLPQRSVTGCSYELVSGEDAPVTGIRYMLRLGQHSPFPPMTVRLGTTRGTNALLTRQGAPTAFVTTSGFGDVLRIGYQDRPRLFDLAIRKPAELYTSVIEIDERIAPDGHVLRAPDVDAVRSTLRAVRERGVTSLAICLLNAYANGEHERLVRAIAIDVGFREISISSAVAALIKLVARGDTTVVDAYLNPVLRQYLKRLQCSLGSARLQILTSAGGLVDAASFVGKDSILSGPAGGVVGFSHVAQAAGFQRAIGFDMGGTSTDVARCDGHFDLEYETKKAGVRIVAPMMAIETVAAGGGSICHFDGVKLAVGPASAGADPGPACYGRGGPLAVTDINFFLGKILARHFPFALDRAAVIHRLQELATEVAAATGRQYTLHELATGLLRIANTNMVTAILSISVTKGSDPRDYVLVAFGGAAGQHACAVAQDLGMTHILAHPDAGILSAYGIGQADLVRHGAAGIYRPYSADQIAALEDDFERLTFDVRDQLVADGADATRIEVRRAIDLRYQGFDACLTIDAPQMGSFAQRYAEEHQRVYGYTLDRPLEIVAIRVAAVCRAVTTPHAASQHDKRRLKPRAQTPVWFETESCQAGIFLRTDLQPGGFFAGPAIICEPTSTTIIDPDWDATILDHGEVLLTYRGADAVSPAPAGTDQDADPVLLEVFNNQLAGIAQRMGITLRNTAVSVNVKERLDFSCAIFTTRGDLVVNAPHIPVHLGAMSATVRAVLRENNAIRPGDVFVTNDPYRGGAHLPDITVVTPVHSPTGNLLFFTASRAHHAEIGGIVPGSMPPCSRNLAEEGVLIDNFKLMDAGQPRWDALRQILLDGDYPSRAVADNLADIAAQLAANRSGANELLELIDRHSLPVVSAYMQHIQVAAERKMRLALGQLPDGTYAMTDHMDDGSPIAVGIRIDGDSATIDFSGTGPVVSSNLNANRAIVSAAVMYCLRCLIAEDIPLNQGVLAPVTIILPPCMLNPPRHADPAACAAVVGGNVETSQRVVDVILGALGTAAASQGTMNNVMFGNDRFGYYETICGGAGATQDAAGADAVHTHMTNTRMTDPEILEHRFPIRVHQFAIRSGSGGAGRNRGGDGVIRRIEFLGDLSLSILSQRRGDYPPFGLAGGTSGAIGENRLIRADGHTEKLSGCAQLMVYQGDQLEVLTPGGGGYGRPNCGDHNG